jgi:hypothetical protein
LQAFKKGSVDILPYIQGLRRYGNMSEKMKRDSKISLQEKVFMVVAAIGIAVVLMYFVNNPVQTNAKTYIVDTQEITVDYTEAEEFFLNDFEKRYSDYELYDSGDLTADILEHRNGKRIIERCVGIVTDSETCDGMILNTDPDHYYISYAGIDGVTDGTVVLSYMVYSTTDNSVDGIEERYDYVVSREYEQEVWM